MKPPASLIRDLGRAVATVALTAASTVWAGTIVDAHNERVTAEAPSRIVTLGSATTETVMALGKADALVAADASSKPCDGKKTPPPEAVR